MTVIMVIILIPVIYVFEKSFDIGIKDDLSLSLIPRKFTFLFYDMLSKDKAIVRSFINSVTVTIVGTILSVVLNAMAAYALMKKELPGNRFLVYYLVILPMLFSGGLVPTYLTIKSLGLIDKFAVLILPVLIKGWSIALIRNYYLTIPASLLESARIDGAKEMSVFSKIMVPLSKPVLAAMSIFTGVSYWNSFFSAVIYINSPQKYTFPVKLREMIIVQYDMSGQLIEVAKMAAGQSSLPTSLLQEGLTSAVIVISILPIALIYPFLQKYFTKGILLSSLKE